MSTRSTIPARPSPRSSHPIKKSTLLTALVLGLPSALAETCISLAGSTTCPGFNSSSISTDSTLVGLFPFLAYVSSTSEFDTQLAQYVQGDYVKTKYQDILGCDNINLSNTTDYYARYTTSFICNGIVQNSKTPCGVSDADAPPLCADSCAEFATSEEGIAANSQLCSNPGSDYLSQIRADFTNCALPADSLSTSCILGSDNEPDNCGFSSDLVALCSYCGSSSPNATDSCCDASNVNSRCQGVTIASSTSSLPPLFTTTVTASGSKNTSSATGAAGAHLHHGLSAGALAGIVIGSVLAFALLLALVVLCCIFLRRRRDRSQNGSVLNQPTPQRRGQSMTYAPQAKGAQNGYEVLPGGRVARMSALQGQADSPRGVGAVGAVPASRGYQSDTDPYGDSPESDEKGRPPITGRRNGSLSSGEVLAAGDVDSPRSNQFSSPEGVASGQSEQLPFFKDYYSSEEIHPNEKVSVLWAYQPRAADEFELERGDMLKVVGIWDDGWATGVRINDRAEDYDGKHKVQRDSGVSNGSNGRSESPPPTGEIKAFPLVCVCLPEAWRKTVEGDSSTDSAGGNPPDI